MNEKMKPNEFCVAAFQQTIAMFAGLVMVPLIVARGMGADGITGQNMVSIAILAGGISTALQSVRYGGWIGSGYPLMMGSSSMFIVPSIMAGKAGGAALIFGMTLLLAPVEMLLAPFARYFKRFTPGFLPGMIVILLACSVLPVSMNQFCGGADASASGISVLQGFLTILFIAIASCSPWRIIRIGSIVFGSIAGTIASCLLNRSGIFAGFADACSASAWIAAPPVLWYGKPAFSADLILPFALAYVLTSLETYGDVCAIAYVSGDDVRKLDYRRVRGGLITDALGSLLAGLFGTTANTSFSGNIAIAKMSGIISRYVGYLVGFLLILLSFSPKLSAFIVAMPAGVLGGSMLVASFYLFYVGLTMLRDSGGSDADFLIAACGIAAGLSVQMSPQIAAIVPGFLSGVLRSGVCTGVITVLLFCAVRGILEKSKILKNKVPAEQQKAGRNNTK